MDKNKAYEEDIIDEEFITPQIIKSTKPLDKEEISFILIIYRFLSLKN